MLRLLVVSALALAASAKPYSEKEYHVQVTFKSLLQFQDMNKEFNYRGGYAQVKVNIDTTQNHVSAVLWVKEHLRPDVEQYLTNEKLSFHVSQVNTPNADHPHRGFMVLKWKVQEAMRQTTKLVQKVRHSLEIGQTSMSMQDVRLLDREVMTILRGVLAMVVGMEDLAMIANISEVIGKLDTNNMSPDMDSLIMWVIQMMELLERTQEDMMEENIQSAANNLFLLETEMKHAKQLMHNIGWDTRDIVEGMGVMTIKLDLLLLS